MRNASHLVFALLNTRKEARTIFDYSIFTNTVRRVYPTVKTPFSERECLAVFKYYFDSFEQFTGRPHPPISGRTVAAIIEKMSETEGGEPLCPDTYYDLIDLHFQTDYADGCDYRIRHFFSGKIRDFRLMECT